MVQWLGLCTFIAEGAGLTPDQGTKISQAAPLRATCVQKKAQIFILCPVRFTHSRIMNGITQDAIEKECGQNVEPVKLKRNSVDLQHLCFIENASTGGIITLINLIFFRFR